MEQPIIRSQTITIQVREANGQYKATYVVPANAKKIVGIIVSAKIVATNVQMNLARHIFFAMASQTPVGDFKDFLQKSGSTGYRVEKPYTSNYAYQEFTVLLSEYLFYACPLNQGVPTLEINGQKGGFEDPITIKGVKDAITDASAQDYYVFRSTERWSGTAEINAY